MNSIFFEKVLKLDEFSKSDLTDLSQKRFLIIGAGGIAHPLIMNLLGHGVKHLSKLMVIKLKLITYIGNSCSILRTLD